jgi:hypothetical protein
MGAQLEYRRILHQLRVRTPRFREIWEIRVIGTIAMDTPSEVERLARQVAAGHAGAAEAFRRQVEPALVCMVGEILRAGAGPTDLGKAIRGVFSDCFQASPLDAPVARRAAERLAGMLADRLIACLSEPGASGETVLRHWTVDIHNSASLTRFAIVPGLWPSTPERIDDVATHSGVPPPGFPPWGFP